MSCKPTKKKEKAAEEGGMRRGRIQLEPSGTSGLCLGITRHPCDYPHALFVRQPSAAESCKRVGEGGKATSVGAPDADISLEAIKELRKRTIAGAATFLVRPHVQAWLSWSERGTVNP